MIDQNRLEEISKTVSKTEAAVVVYRQVGELSLRNIDLGITYGQDAFVDAWMTIEQFCREKLSENLKLLDDLSKELKDSD
jgi:hypothetical protein